MAAGVVVAGQVEVEQVRICYGGVAPKCVMATNAQAALEGQAWSQASLDAALLAVAKDVNITPDAPGLQLPLPACVAALRCAVLRCTALCRAPPFLSRLAMPAETLLCLPVAVMHASFTPQADVECSV